jgi:hypothetical protein
LHKLKKMILVKQNGIKDGIHLNHIAFQPYQANKKIMFFKLCFKILDL